MDTGFIMKMRACRAPRIAQGAEDLAGTDPLPDPDADPAHVAVTCADPATMGNLDHITIAIGRTGMDDDAIARR